MVLSATSSIDETLRTETHVIVVAGPTATGKSSLAIQIAREFDGVVINADSQQRYRDLQILSARPTSADRAIAPHKLFGDFGADEKGSAVEWAEKAAGEINCAVESARLPVVVGGTGLYLRALMDGLVDIPPIPTDVRDASEALLAEIGNEEFYERLKARDPETARNLALGDTHRLLRTWTVLEATGTPLREWRALPPSPPLCAKYYSIVMMPKREELYNACNMRFDEMIEKGVIEELKAFLDEGGLPTSSVMKILGARELSKHLLGEVTLEGAIDAAKISIRRYAKRQVTWFRHQLAGTESINSRFSEAVLDRLFSNIRHFLSI
jgi:tRNA dimethylallyltransferase